MSTEDRITGAVKFFERNFALFRDGASATATSNEDSVHFILDISRYTQWESLVSNDLTTETIIVQLPFAKTIDSLFLVDMNFKGFNVKYNNGGTFTDFSNVVGINNESKANISETDYARNTAFYQFDEVTTDQIQIECQTTQVVDAQKFLGQFITSLEIGTLKGFPRVMPASKRNERKANALSRRAVVQKTYETNNIKINFKTHPFQEDEDIIEKLFDSEETFLVYPCGGREGTQYFKVEQKNWRINDIYNMQIIGTLKNEYEKGVYTLGFKKSIRLEEHI